jgi:hypothetical protein
VRFFVLYATSTFTRALFSASRPACSHPFTATRKVAGSLSKRLRQ